MNRHRKPTPSNRRRNRTARGWRIDPHAPEASSGSSDASASNASLPSPAPPLKTIESVLSGKPGRQSPRKTQSPSQAQTQSALSKPRTDAPERYHRQSRRPWVCFLFVMPLILTYELTTLTFFDSAHRSGMDQWLVHFLNWFGLGELIILPVVTTGILLLAHHRRRDPWHFRPTVLGWMVVESLGLGLLLFWAANAFYLIAQTHPVVTAPLPISSPQWWGQTVSLVGCGIYEELIFRLILVTLTAHLLYLSIWKQQAQWLSILLVSLLFASLHYDFINPAGAAFDPSTFSFRFLASVIFSMLFLFRGFGIAVGTHIAFDVLTQV